VGESKSVGVLFPRRLLQILPLTPLSPLPLPRNRGSAFALPSCGHIELSRAFCAASSVWGSRQGRLDHRLV